MFGGLRNWFGRSKASIGKDSNHNIIVQNSEINNPVFCTGSTDMIGMLGKLEAYDEIQQQVQNVLSATKKTHPLYPVFSATYDKELDALVSTPETEDAFKQYPKIIKGTSIRDITKYPYMGKDEMPWEYAYRTQTTVEMKTTAYQEYLGDIKDPFPTLKYSDGMILQIIPPEFPPAKEAAISSGEISIPFQLRRRPWLEYNELCFGSESDNCGLDIRIILYKDIERIKVTISKVPGISLEMQLQREKLLEAMAQTKQFSIIVDGVQRIPYPIADDELNSTLLSSAKRMVRYYECLLNIERVLRCTFDPNVGDVSWDDYKTALILSDSLEQRWHRFQGTFDGDLRCDYDHIPDDLTDINYETSGMAITGKELKIVLQGLEFDVDEYIILYQDARLNNIESVMKNKQKRRENILMTFRPEKGKDRFFKYCRFEGIRVVASEHRS